MKYAKSTNGFYDPEINLEIPEDAVEITIEKWQSLMTAQANGQMIKADKAGNPIAVDRPNPTGKELITLCESATQKNLDDVSKSWGYSSIVSAISYLSSTNPQYKADAESLNSWRDATWDKVYEIEAGTMPKTVDDFLVLLPVAPVQPKI